MATIMTTEEQGLPAEYEAVGMALTMSAELVLLLLMIHEVVQASKVQQTGMIPSVKWGYASGSCQRSRLVSFTEWY